LTGDSVSPAPICTNLHQSQLPALFNPLYDQLSLFTTTLASTLWVGAELYSRVLWTQLHNECGMFGRNPIACSLNHLATAKAKSQVLIDGQ